MNLLYIDRAKDISDIRIGEQTIFSKYLSQFQNNVTFLLIKGEKRTSRNKINPSHKVYYRKNTFFLKKQISLDFLIILFKGIFICKKEKIDVIIARKDITTGKAAWIIARFLKLKFVFILSFPTWEIINEKSNKYGFSSLFKLYSYLYKKNILFLIKVSDLVILQTRRFIDNIPLLNNFEEKIISLPMGFDEDWLIKSKVFLHNDIFEIPNDRRYVLYFGSIDPERKIDFLLQIIAQVKNSIPK